MKGSDKVKIYINDQHQIKAIGANDTGDVLEEIEVEDSFLSRFCDTAKKGFCYHRWTQDDGSECLSVYPYKNITMLMTIQEQYEADQQEFAQLRQEDNSITEYQMDLDYRLSMTELGL